jgi:PAS domain S-box-containing protein
MKLFATNEEVATLEVVLASLSGQARLASLVDLAWALRECDCTRALLLADEADALLASAEIIVKEQQSMFARLQLVRGTIHWLFVDLDAAEKCANLSIGSFQLLADNLGVGDGKWLLASIWEERGNTQLRDEYLELLIENYRTSGDKVRLDTGIARLIERTCYRDSKISADRLDQIFDSDNKNGKVLEAWVASARATVAAHSGKSGRAIRFYLQAHEAALDTGQIRQAVLSATNAADNFAMLSDLDAALEWNERALALARASHCPSIKAIALFQTGNVLRLLGRFDSAKVLLNEALQAMAGMKLSYRYALALQYLGELSLNIGEHANALEYFSQANEHKSVLWEAAFVLLCWRGEANALCCLGRFEEANTKVSSALVLAKQVGMPSEEIKVLQICAQLIEKHALPPPAGMTAVEATLSYLHQALAVAACFDGYQLPIDLLDEIASAYAAAHNFEKAYSYGRVAATARDNGRVERARDRAIAMQAREETKRIRDEGEKMRQLAQTESQRATVLQEASSTLETLSVIGREITASLNTEAVFEALYRHVHQLLDASSFVIFLIDEESNSLNLSFGMEEGVRLFNHNFSLNDATTRFVQCARERKEIVINLEPELGSINAIAGTLPTISMLYDPLMVGERVLGVMSIQSVNVHAYGERERSIFHTLCAYGAIGLGNASAYASAENARHQANLALEELRQTQANLRQSEERWAFALEGSGDGVWDWDIINDKILLSKRWKEMLGYEEHEIGTQPIEWLSRIHPDDLSSVTETVQANVDGNTPNSSCEHRVQCKDGNFLWVLGRGIVVQRDGVGKALRMVGTSTDISERKNIDRMKSEFISTVSHELRTPLTSIRGSLGLLESGVLGELPPKALNLIKIANKNSQRLVMLVNDILDMDKLVAGKMTVLSEKVNLLEIVKNAIEANSAYAASYHVRYQLVLVQHQMGIMVKADANRLMQVLTNLLSNAAKFSHSNNVVDIRFFREADFFRVEVEDRGDGIPNEFKSQIFGAFSQAGSANTRQQGGTGLGLNISKRLVCHMGGDMGYHSEVGKGTTFWFTVPALQEVGIVATTT